MVIYKAKDYQDMTVCLDLPQVLPQSELTNN